MPKFSRQIFHHECESLLSLSSPLQKFRDYAPSYAHFFAAPVQIDKIDFAIECSGVDLNSREKWKLVRASAPNDPH